MQRPPTKQYCGITLILDEPSRFDKDYGKLLSGPAEIWMNNEVLKTYDLSIDNFDVRDASCVSTPLHGTKGVILMGDTAANKFANVTPDPPGYLTLALGKPAIATFFPQDCCDHKNMRRQSAATDEGAVSDRETKEKQTTARENYRFWTKWHVRKFVSFIQSGAPTPPPIKPIFNPHLGEMCSALDTTVGSTIYLDIETSRQYGCLTCIGWSTEGIFPKIYVAPVYRYNGELGYGDFHKFYRSLSLALSRNTVVIHNAMFDLLVLCGFYHMCYPLAVYDTMAAHHRCFLEAEKSLAHAISTWTWQPNHKDFATEVHSSDGERSLWLYNAKDVYNLKLIKDAQEAYAATVPGLADSIAQVNGSIVPYLDTTLTGLPLDLLALSRTATKLEKLKALYARMATILVGSSFNPGSSKQCAEFFHRKLGYEVVSKTTAGAAALGSKQLYQLQLKYPNPLLPVIIKYRTVAKDLSMLESELLEIL